MLRGRGAKEVKQSFPDGEKTTVTNACVVQTNLLKISSPMNGLCTNKLQNMTYTTEIVTDTKVSHSVINVKPLTYKVSESTLIIPVPETVPVHQIPILGPPILHLALTQTNLPWIQLMKMGITPIAAEFCFNKTFASRISPDQQKLGYSDSDRGISHSSHIQCCPASTTARSLLTSGRTHSPGGRGQITLAEASNSTSHY